ncbi:hypothetical protein LSH36_11g13075 [Paralvinella palmiformis]|uniref:EF-hand domain-containing protein n=1 Tax=Paralvinella palmiformis TaxID=53620 RepID=A0AAD9NGM9_9ANNE|nr:hypothetical protein LSH36_11g13075 [Paralvinella palmiformis]
MSADEDTELRDLVAQALESNGVLGKIKAQLRASVFLALEEQESIHNKSPMQNEELKKYLNTKDGKLVASLVREFLEFFHLDFSLAVFEPESGVGGDIYNSRSSLAKDLGLSDIDSQPLIAGLMKKNTSEMGRITSNGEDLTPKQITAAREKFHYYDTDKNGTIEKDELRKLFCDIFPGFHRNMIDRYVNDEFRAADRDLNNAIDFDEFLGMYKRLFVQCRSVVSNDMAMLMSPRRSPDLTSKIPSPTKRFEGTAEESSFSFLNLVENKNKLNESDTKSAADSKQNSVDPDDKKDEDSFFDDPIPNSSEHSRSFSSDKSREKRDTKTNNLPKSGGFLSGAPPLNGSDKGVKQTNFEKDLDKNFADLGLDVQGDDYDDDFESANISPVGHTPRSARSDHNIKSLEDEIEEEIDEVLSGTEDLLKSDNSGTDGTQCFEQADDLTTDRTVSPTELSTAFDYAEEIHLP